MKFVLFAVGLISLSQGMKHHNYSFFDNYCNEFVTCNKNQICMNNVCITKRCKNSEDCGTGFECSNQKCVSIINKIKAEKYCDALNPCKNQQHCSKGICVSSKCQHSKECATGFVCIKSKCTSLATTLIHMAYCDSQNPCSSQNQCFFNKCYPKLCITERDCPNGLSCTNNQCIQYEQFKNVSKNTSYCDKQSPCEKTHQCINNKCVPFTCENNQECSLDYRCYKGHCYPSQTYKQQVSDCDRDDQCGHLQFCLNNVCKNK